MRYKKKRDRTTMKKSCVGYLTYNKSGLYIHCNLWKLFFSNVIDKLFNLSFILE